MTPYLFCPTEGVMGNAAEHHDCDHRHGMEWSGKLPSWPTDCAWCCRHDRHLSAAARTQACAAIWTGSQGEPSGGV